MEAHESSEASVLRVWLLKQRAIVEIFRNRISLGKHGCVKGRRRVIAPAAAGERIGGVVSSIFQE